jgi:hypothetical protein
MPWRPGLAGLRPPNRPPTTPVELPQRPVQAVQAPNDSICGSSGGSVSSGLSTPNQYG